jgi:hypothetical protein
MTAVEFLESRMALGIRGALVKVIDQAKEMEKQQIIDAIAESNKSNNRNVSLNPEQYYKETFKII